MNTSNWIDLKQDADTGIETIRAHFEGHAYDPHWHDAYLVGFTEQGVQRFHCGRQRYDSVPGKVILTLATIMLCASPRDSGGAKRKVTAARALFGRERNLCCDRNV